MKIMVFLHGTVLMHRNAHGRTRVERVRQVIEGDESLYDFASYIPVGNSVAKLHHWKKQGAEVLYLSSHRDVDDVNTDEAVLRKHGFPYGRILFRQKSEQYKDAAESALPDILIEDDCESIGGEREMTYPQIEEVLMAKVKSIVVQEFGGIDHLPDDLAALMSY